MPELLAEQGLDQDGTNHPAANFHALFPHLDQSLDVLEYECLYRAELWTYFDRLAGARRPIVVAATGFGLGLQFLIVWHLFEQWGQTQSDSQLILQFVCLEQAPPTRSKLAQLHKHLKVLAGKSKALQTLWPPAWRGWHQLDFVAGQVQLHLLFGRPLESLQRFSFLADIWLLDTHLHVNTSHDDTNHWNTELFASIAKRSRPTVRFVYQNAIKSTRHGLSRAGFTVRKQISYDQGHMLYGERNGEEYAQCASPLIKSRIAIIGAGYAGLQLAQALAPYGQELVLFDQNSAAMTGASRNHAHLAYLKPRPHMNPFNDLFAFAHAQAARCYSENPGVHATGSVQLVSELKPWLGQALAAWPTDWLQALSVAEVSELVGVTVDRPGLFLPNAKVIEPIVYGRALLERLKVESRFGHSVSAIRPLDEGWQLSTGQQWEYYDRVVLCGGAQSMQLLSALGNKPLGATAGKASHWRYPLRPIGGQSAVVSSTHPRLRGLRMPVCSNSYVIPNISQVHTLGSQFLPGQWALTPTQQGFIENVTQCQQELPFLKPALAQAKFVASYAGTRAQSTDYLPMVGRIFDELGSNLFLFAGFGAKGSLLTPLCAQILAHSMLDLASPVDHETLLWPGRFEARLGRKGRLDKV